MKILAIESSCDETAASVIENIDGDVEILSNVVASQIDIHKKFGGVFPEIASRAHTENIIPVIQEALNNAKTVILSGSEESSGNASLDPSVSPQDDISDIDVIAVTSGPGLIGSLLVGVNTAKALAYANDKPIIGINHWLGHIYSTFSGEVESRKSKVKSPKFPLLALIVSGGHTGLILMKSHTDIQTIGQTLDDAAGEAFDKVAKILGLEYPGGPAIGKAAEEYKQRCHSGQVGDLDPESRAWIPDVGVPSDSRMTIKFPRSMLDRDNFDFSFSGLKTSVLYKVQELTKKYPLDDIKNTVAYEFQQCVIDILIGKTLKAAEKHQPKSILLCGGVSANKELREQMAKAVLSFQTGRRQDLESSSGSPMSDAVRLEDDKIGFYVPPMELTGDNAAMIGLAAAYQIQAGVKPTTYDKIDADSNLKL